MYVITNIFLYTMTDSATQQNVVPFTTEYQTVRCSTYISKSFYRGIIELEMTSLYFTR